MANSRLTLCVFLSYLACLIVTTAAIAGDGRHADAVSVFQCAFDEDWDENYDRWPDRWVRKTGRNWPHYVNIEIEDDPTAAGGKCLTIAVDGAAAAISSPPINVMPRFGYVFEAQLKNEGLAHSSVVLSLDFCDKSGRVLQTRKSKPIATTTGWQKIRLDKIELNKPEIDRVVIGLEVIRGAKGDLKGRVSLADVWLARLPRISVSTNSACNVYPRLDEVVVRCELSGIRERDPEIRFQLLDALGNIKDAGSFQLNGQLIAEEARRAADILDGIGEAPAGYEGTTEWRPKIQDYGFYRVVVKMLSSEAARETDGESELGSRTVWLAVVPPLPMPKHGEFGWTLPQGERPLSFQDLSQLLPQVGINWLKVPTWFDATDPRRGDDLIRFVELLSASNIEVVGIIDQPPAGSELASRIGRDAPVADLLSPDASTWSPALEPVMTRLSLRVRWWQLGRDGDTSFAGFAGLNKRIDELRTQLFRFGQDVRLGMSWDWRGARQESGRVSWDFEQLCLAAPPTEHQFEELLAKPRSTSALRWVLVDPPQAGDSSQSSAAALDARSSEFVRRLVAAKVHGADAIIVPNPFNDENGLMHASGGPAELLLPWRTTAAMLGGAEYLGQLQLPAGSKNRVFLRPDSQVVMVVWNAEPAQEILHLGSDVRHINIWGITTAPALVENEQVINVGPVPTFVLGLHEAITRWRMAMSFERDEVPSVFGKPHPNSLHFQNFFSQGVGGSLRIVVPQEEETSAAHSTSEEKVHGRSGFMPDRWSIEPPQKSFQLARGERLDFPFDIRLKNALYGRQPVRIEFTIEADEPYQFTVYRQMEVGTKDLTLNVDSHVDKFGTLIVEQFMQNKAERLADFRCSLYAKGRRLQRAQVYRLGENLDRKVYRYANGNKLVGQEMLLEIEEMNGPRVLKFRFVAKEDTDRKEADDMEAEHQQVDGAKQIGGAIGGGTTSFTAAG